MTTKTVSQLNADGYFVCSTVADESPLEKGVFLFPAGAVDAPPPTVPDGQLAKLVGDDWVFEDIPPPPEPEPVSEPAPPDPKMVGVEFEGVMCSATRDDQNGLLAVETGFRLVGQNFTTRFYFSNGNTIVFTKDNFLPCLQVWMPFRQSFFKPE